MRAPHLAAFGLSIGLGIALACGAGKPICPAESADPCDACDTCDKCLARESAELGPALPSLEPEQCCHVAVTDPPDDEVMLASEDDQLGEKLAALEKLQSEVDALRRAAGKDKQIQLDIKVLEISLSRMRAAGIRFSDFGLAADRAESTASEADADSAKSSPNVGLESAKRDAIARLIVALKEAHSVKVLAEPTLVTTDRRRAYFLSGGELPVRSADGAEHVAGRKIGTEVDLLTNLLAGDRVRIELRAGQSEADPALDGTVDGITWPGVRSRKIETTFEIELGKTAVIGGTVEQTAPVPAIGRHSRRRPSDPDVIQTVFLVTPQLVTVR